MKHLLIACGACLLLSGCGKSESPEATPRAVKTAVKPVAKPVATPAPPLYDSAGNLLPSGEMIAWLEVPRGLTKLPVSSGTFHAYVAEGIASDRIQAFFGARVLASHVHKLGPKGVRMSNGIPPLGAKARQSVVDVTIAAGARPNEISVRILEHPYVTPLPKFTTADARILLKQEQNRAE